MRNCNSKSQFCNAYTDLQKRALCHFVTKFVALLCETRWCNRVCVTKSAPRLALHDVLH